MAVLNFILGKFRKFGGQQGHNLKLTIDILDLMMKSIKKKLKVLGCYNGSFLKRGHRFVSCFKEGLLIKKMKNLLLQSKNRQKNVYKTKNTT